MAQTSQLPDYKPSLILDTTQRCNFRCRMCFWSRPEVARKLTADDPTMSIELFRLALESAMPFCSTIGLAGGGEFLTDPMLEDRLTLLGDALRQHPEVRFHQTTNGSLLTAERLQFLKGVKRVGFIVSIDSLDALTYASIRRPGTLSKVLENLRGLRRSLNALGVEDIHLQLNVVMMKRNLFSLPEVLRFAHEVDASVFADHPQGFGPDDIQKESLFHAPVFSNRFLEKLHGLAQVLKVALFTPPPFAITDTEVEAYFAASRNAQPSCYQLDRSGPLQVLPNGDVAVCCQGLVFGNLHKQDFPDILASPLYGEYRAAIADGQPLPPCDHCRHLFREAPYLYESQVYDMDIPPKIRNLEPEPDFAAEGFFDWLDELSEQQLRHQLRQDYLADSRKLAALGAFPEVAAVLRDKEINDKLRTWIKGRVKVVVYPSGGQADWLMANTLLPLVEIVGFSDRNPALRGTAFHGIPIVSPDEIPSLRPDIVVVASELFQEEILTQLAHLETLGIKLETLPNRSIPL